MTEEIEVEKILYKKGDKFCIKWKGYDIFGSTLEPSEHLTNCQGKLEDFYLISEKTKEPDWNNLHPDLIFGEKIINNEKKERRGLFVNVRWKDFPITTLEPIESMQKYSQQMKKYEDEKTRIREVMEVEQDDDIIIYTSDFEDDDDYKDFGYPS